MAPSLLPRDDQDDYNLRLGLRIAFGVVIFVLALSLAFFLRRHRHKKQMQAMQAMHTQWVREQPACHLEQRGKSVV